MSNLVFDQPLSRSKFFPNRIEIYVIELDIFGFHNAFLYFGESRILG